MTNAGMVLPSDQDASGRTLGAEELKCLADAIASGTLTSTKGTFTKTFEEGFARKIGTKFAYANSSGTAAIHIAIAALDPEPGDEIVTSPITDMGALTPILYQAAVPVFAEVDPRTWNVTAKTIEPMLSSRTKAIIVTHLFGNPCEMDAINKLAASNGIPVIEDCAQAFLAKSQGKMIGTCGTISCFSLQQGKHITTGEGGIVATDDPELARKMFLFVNKAWGYGDANPDHYFLAMNYRMSELQGAVALGQLPKLEDVARRRIAAADSLTKKLVGLKGIQTPYVRQGDVHTYWKYCLRVDSKVIPGGSVALGKELKARQISSVPRYIQKPAFMCRIFQDQKTFGKSRFPFTLARPEVLRYEESRFPLTMQSLQEILVLPWNENYVDAHVNFISDAIHDAVEQLSH
jgi:perosamine synthetase